MDFNNKKNCIQDLKYITLYIPKIKNNKKINNLNKSYIQDHKYKHQYIYNFIIIKDQLYIPIKKLNQ